MATSVSESKPAAVGILQNSIPLIICAACVGALIYVRSSPVSPNRKSVEIVPAFHDFGDVRQKEDLTHVFVLRNVGSVPVQITATHSMCSCSLPNAEILGAA